MTKEELLKELGELEQVGRDDAEAAHIAADNLLLSYIGDDDVIDGFKSIKRWYS